MKLNQMALKVADLCFKLRRRSRRVFVTDGTLMMPFVHL